MNDVISMVNIESGENPVFRGLYQSMQETLHVSKYLASLLRTPPLTLGTGTMTIVNGTTTTRTTLTVLSPLGLKYDQ